MLSSFDFDLVIHVTLFIMFFYLFISVIYSLYYYDFILLFLFFTAEEDLEQSKRTF